MTVEHSRTAHSRSRLPGINGLRKARAVGAYIIRAGAWLQRISADTNAGYVQCENAFAERPVALRMILRRCYDASARERSANIASVTAIDIGVSVTGGVPALVGLGANGDTYECSHYERTHDLLHLRSPSEISRVS